MGKASPHMLKFAKPIIGLFLFVVFLGTLLLTPAVARAQGPQQIGGSTVTAESVSDAINSPTPNLANTTAYVFYTILVITCRSFQDPQACGVMSNDASGDPVREGASLVKPNSISEALDNGGAIGGMSFLMAEMVGNPPASAQVYVADVASNSRFGAQPAYAQGLGFGSLSPILGTWKAFRDVSYYLLTIIFLIVGFLILMRHKVSGNVAVTVQNALPRLVITLILITFSYAIAGLIVDVMFLAIYFLVNLFNTRIFENYDARTLAVDTHLFYFMTDFIFKSSGAWQAAQALGSLVYSSFQAALFGIGIQLPGPSSASGGVNLLEAAISIIFILIFAIALIIAMFRTFFALIMSYAGFVVNVVLSPFILLAGAIPGNGSAFANWIKNLIAGLAPFVVAIFMIFMALALTGQNTKAGIGYEGVDPRTGEAANLNADGEVEVEGLRLPLILTGDIDASAVVGVLAMGLMLMLPEAVNLTKKMVGAQGGIFDEFRDKALGNFKQGWTGNKYVPGAKAVVSKAGQSAAFATAGGIAGGYRGQGLGGKIKGAAIGAGAGALAPIVAPPVVKLGKTVSKTWKEYGQPVDQLTRAKTLTDYMNTGRDILSQTGQRVEESAAAGAGPNIVRNRSTPGDQRPRKGK